MSGRYTTLTGVVVECEGCGWVGHRHVKVDTAANVAGFHCPECEATREPLAPEEDRA